MENSLASLAVREGKRRGADDVAATSVKEDAKMIRFANNEVTVSQSWRSTTIYVMVSIRKKVAIGVIEDLSEGSMKQSISELIKIAKTTRPNRSYARLPVGPFRYRSSHADLSVQSSNLVKYVKDAISSAVSSGADRVAGSLVFRSSSTGIETSAGASGNDSLSSLEISVRAFSGIEASGQSNSCARSEKDFHPEQAGKAAAEIAKKAVNPLEGKSGKYDVILGPNVVANLMNDVISAASAFNVDAGLSFIAGMLTKRVASKSLTLVDDGTLSDGLNSRAFDDEGLPTQKTIVIKNGVLQSFLHNSSTAKKFGRHSTANAGWIVPQPWNIIVERGGTSEEGLFSDLGDGIFITNNWYTRFQNYRTGDFSTVCRDGIFRVADGEIVQSLKGLRISENLPRLLRNISCLSDKQYWVKWWEVEFPTLTPYVLVKDVNLTKSLE